MSSGNNGRVSRPTIRLVSVICAFAVAIALMSALMVSTSLYQGVINIPLILIARNRTSPATFPKTKLVPKFTPKSNLQGQTSCPLKSTRIRTSETVNKNYKKPPQWSEVASELKNRFLNRSGPNCPFQLQPAYIDHEREGEVHEVWLHNVIVQCAQHAAAGFSVPNAGYASSGTMHKNAISQFPVRNKRVLVVGSLLPWIEVMALGNGAATVTTVDYNLPVYRKENRSAEQLIELISVPDLAKSSRKFDVIFSYSSVEHDGLGRYGDELNPSGDVRTVRRFRELLDTDGLLFLGVPVNKNHNMVAFNAHRVYSQCGLEHLTAGFKFEGGFVHNESKKRKSLKETLLACPGKLSQGSFIQPLLVFRRLH